MMELHSYQCDFQLACCQQTYHSILNEHRDELFKTKQNSAPWHNARMYRITGSRCYEIYTYRGTNWKTKANKYFWPKSFTNKFVKHGLKYENTARTAFVSKTGFDVYECGMIIDENNKWLGFSPDGLVLENGTPKALLEIKCLYAGKCFIL